MVAYVVTWNVDGDLSKGKGRATHNESLFCFTVLCRSIADASACLEILFLEKYRGKFSLVDGVSSFRRMKLDSRNFDIQYLFMDGIRKPICLFDLKRTQNFM